MSDEPARSYRARNIALAVIAGAFVVAAIVRVGLYPPSEPATDAAIPGAIAPSEPASPPAVLPPAASAEPNATVDSASAPVATTVGPPGALTIPVHLALGPGVSLAPATTVFLIVRATDGSPMPLAVKRFAVSDLPKDLTLSEADAMVPGRSIRAAATIELVARASLNGNVKPVAGDYEGRSGIIKIADITAPIVLSIDHPL